MSRKFLLFALLKLGLENVAALAQTGGMPPFFGAPDTQKPVPNTGIGTDLAAPFLNDAFDAVIETVTGKEDVYIDEKVHVLFYFNYDKEIDESKKGVTDSNKISDDVVIFSMQSYVNDTSLSQEERAQMEKYINWRTNVPYASLTNGGHIRETYLPFVFTHDATRYIGKKDKSTTPDGEVVIEYDAQHPQRYLDKKMKEHTKQRETARKLLYMLYYNDEVAQGLGYSSLKALISQYKAENNSFYKEALKTSSYGMWGKWYNETDGWHRGIDIVGPTLDPNNSTKPLYAICDGIIVHRTSYYFNTYVPGRDVTVTYMHLQSDTHIFEYGDGLTLAEGEKIILPENVNNQLFQKQLWLSTLLNLRHVLEVRDKISIRLDSSEPKDTIKQNDPSYQFILSKLSSLAIINNSVAQAIGHYTARIQSSEEIIPSELYDMFNSLIQHFREGCNAPIVLKGQYVGYEFMKSTPEKHTHVEMNPGCFQGAINRPTIVADPYYSTYASQVCDITPGDTSTNGFSKNPYEDIEYFFEQY